MYLTGVDPRIRCSCCVGMMTTWRDYLLNRSFTHTWMVYLPGLPPELDYPEILGLNLPNPVMVLNNREDQLFTLPEMERADRMLTAVYAKAKLSDRYRANTTPGRTSSIAPCRPMLSIGSIGGSKVEVSPSRYLAGAPCISMHGEEKQC